MRAVQDVTTGKQSSRVNNPSLLAAVAVEKITKIKGNRSNLYLILILHLKEFDIVINIFCFDFLYDGYKSFL